MKATKNARNNPGHSAGGDRWSESFQNEKAKIVVAVSELKLKLLVVSWN
jgi:hypothetical protein